MPPFRTIVADVCVRLLPTPAIITPLEWNDACDWMDDALSVAVRTRSAFVHIHVDNVKQQLNALISDTLDASPIPVRIRSISRSRHAGLKAVFRSLTKRPHLPSKNGAYGGFLRPVEDTMVFCEVFVRSHLGKGTCYDLKITYAT